MALDREPASAIVQTLESLLTASACPLLKLMGDSPRSLLEMLDASAQSLLPPSTRAGAALLEPLSVSLRVSFLGLRARTRVRADTRTLPLLIGFQRCSAALKAASEVRHMTVPRQVLSISLGRFAPLGLRNQRFLHDENQHEHSCARKV